MTKYDSIWMPLAAYQDVQWSSITCMKNDERWLSHNYYVSYMIMQSNMTMMMCVKINGAVEIAWQHISEWLWKCHNRYVWWLFWGRYKEVYVWQSVSYHGVWMHQRSLHQLSRWERAMPGTEEASNDGKVKVRIIHGLTLVIKNSYTYCKSLLALEAKYYYACS